jgi:hypothetical protein
MPVPRLIGIGPAAETALCQSGLLHATQIACGCGCAANGQEKEPTLASAPLVYARLFAGDKSAPLRHKTNGLIVPLLSGLVI